MPDVFGLALKIARAGFKWPKLTDEGKPATDEDELDPATLPLDDLGTILQWGMGITGTIQTTGGEVAAPAHHQGNTGRAERGLARSVRAGGHPRKEQNRTADRRRRRQRSEA